ncbi:LutC/YkgG family protein [Methyloversatilis thermotolerans]|uniref:LutC/YkgG family protein n=1 Tax=Methyloversatilis thermotolerans TaxID=1346290 RepID=UPI0003634311|nr:LUD domain-containing protein [Methyloversatilis thermotolerans]
MSARERILARLRGAGAQTLAAPDLAAFHACHARECGIAERVEQLCARLSAARAEVLRSSPSSWVDDLRERLLHKGVRSLALSRSQSAALPLAEALQDVMHVISLEGAYESWKQDMFESVTAGFVDAQAAVADIGALVLEHGAACPRSLSLIPPISVLRITTSRVHGSLYEVAQRFRWHECATSNRVLVSSPTRTADIQQVLAYGAHGPCELIVSVVDDIEIEGER